MAQVRVCGTVGVTFIEGVGHDIPTIISEFVNCTKPDHFFTTAAVSVEMVVNNHKVWIQDENSDVGISHLLLHLYLGSYTNCVPVQ